jgi:hypothetical protein
MIFPEFSIWLMVPDKSRNEIASDSNEIWLFFIDPSGDRSHRESISLKTLSEVQVGELHYLKVSIFIHSYVCVAS